MGFWDCLPGRVTLLAPPPSYPLDLAAPLAPPAAAAVGSPAGGTSEALGTGDSMGYW